LELTGRVVDKSGRPVRAEVFYNALDSNPNAIDRGAGVISSDGWKSKPDGTFFLTVWPGKGVIDVRANDGSKYASVDVEKILSKLGVRSRPAGSVHALIPIDADEAKPESLSLTITLEDGVNRKGSVVGPDGKPATGVIAAGLRGGLPGPMKSSEFTIGGLGATTRRLVLFMDSEKKHGAVQPIIGMESDPLTIKLQPLGSATGEMRRVDKSPWAGLSVTAVPYVPGGDKYDNLPSEVMKNQGVFGLIRAPWWRLTKRTATTDDKGRFELDGLVPGFEYSIYISDGDLGEAGTLVTSKSKVKVEWGKTTDLGALEKK
jgi:hypothetical protein